MSSVPAIILPPPAARAPAPPAARAAAPRPAGAIEAVEAPRDRGRARYARPDAGWRQRSDGGREAHGPVRGAVVPLGLGALRRDPGFGQFATAQFLAQALAQELGDGGRFYAAHRDAPAPASDAYLRSGAEPLAHAARPAIFRITA